jgi:pyruvate dehydrogenase E2 component (dihydrolipoamide acetyltransferase)
MDVLMPQLGETVKEGTISAWYKQPGDVVTAGDALFEIETDKTSMEVQAIASGLLSEVRVKLGETVAVGSIIAVIAGEGAAASPSAPSVAPPAPRFNGAANGLPHHPPAGFGPFSEVQTPTRNYGSAKGPDGIRITPLARRLIAQNGLDLAEIARQARSAGRTKIAADDVETALAARGSSPSPIMPSVLVRQEQGSREAIAFSKIRQQTGRHLTQSWQSVPHVLQAVEIDFHAVTKVRDAQKEAFRSQHGAALSFLPFIARAACLALASYPQVNASYDGDRLLLSRDVHLGIAVDLAYAGLVVPVVRHADGMNVSGLAMAIHRLVETARAGKLTPAELEGGTYTISNNGSFGTLFTAPIINVPQVAILSTDAIRKKPVVMETEFGDIIVPRPVGIVAQSFDHRAFDGAYSAAFLSKLKDIIERRDWSAEFA